MFRMIRTLLQARSEISRFAALPADHREVVFYAESSADWPHFEAMVTHLTQQLGQKIAYVTSQLDDPMLERSGPLIESFYIGSGPLRTWFFRGLDARVMVMTLPDLQTTYLKRSAMADVHYVYVFHAISSTHRVYQKGAFDGYDSVLCVGPHHIREIRETERVYGLEPKILIEHGYGRLDAILARAKNGPEYVPSEGPRKKVLVASSWGTGSLIEQPVGRELIGALLAAEHEVTVRLHPMTVRRYPELPADLEREFEGAGRFRVETDMREQASLLESDVMIGDWSGAAFEYAFALERPVLFVDTSPKTNNPEHAKIDLPALEATLRHEIGAVLPVTEASRVNDEIAALCADRESFRARVREARASTIYNLGESGRVAAEYIHGLVEAASGKPA